MRWQQQAKKANVTVGGVDTGRVVVTCNQCGAKWSPNLRTGGHLPRGWWKCPNGCNDEKTAIRAKLDKLGW